MTRENTRLAIAPIDHFTGPRFSWRGWRAEVILKADETQIARCPHEHGHRTIEAGKKCAMAMWRRLPNA